jgi:hypothetical protein
MFRDRVGVRTPPRPHLARRAGGMCGAGMPCECNRGNQVEDVQLLDEEITKH